MSKKSSRGVTSTASSVTKKRQKSSILKASFAPSYLQLSLFASVIQGFESQHLRVHDTSTGRLRCEHVNAAKARISSLAWGYYSTSYWDSKQGSSKKKRKRDLEAAEHAVIAYGSSSSEICMLSAAEGKIVGKLSGVHERGIQDFQFAIDDYSQGWSIGGDGKLVQWDLASNKAIKIISLPDSSISVLSPPSLTAPQILCASPTPYVLSLDEDLQPKIDNFDSFKNAIHTLFRSTTDEAHPSEAFLAADNDRYINVYDIAQKRLYKTLVAGSEVESADFYTPTHGTKTVWSEQLLAVVTREGLVELFPGPFIQQAPVNGDLKSRRKNVTRKAAATVKLISTTSAELVAVFIASLQGPDLVVATAESGVDVTFQKVRWQDEGNGELLFDGVKEVKHNKSISTLNTVAMNRAKNTGKSHLDESKTVVINGDANGSSHNAAIEIDSSDDENKGSGDKSEEEEDSAEDIKVVDEQDGDSDDSDDSDAEHELATEDVTPVSAGPVDEEMVGNLEEPSFGELLAGQHPEISVADALQPASSTLVQVEDNKTVLIPSGVSLSTVLTQSLRTNDQNLLESCLHNTDADIIKNTVQRLDSSLAGILLQKLAERLASRPGRYGHLLMWVQWTCVVHGGAVAARPEVFSKIQSLYRVLSQRSRSLDSLLLLKGKLDMLDAQLTFRRDLHNRRGARYGREQSKVIYIDENDNWSSDEDEAMGGLPASVRPKKLKKSFEQLAEDSDSDDASTDDVEMPAITNGAMSAVDEEKFEHDDSVSESERLNQKAKPKVAARVQAIFDEEAEESHASDQESLSSDEVEESEDETDSEMDGFIVNDSAEEEEEEEEEVEEVEEVDEKIVQDVVTIDSDESADESESLAEESPKKKTRRA